MKTMKSVRFAAVALACWGMLLPRISLAGNPLPHNGGQGIVDVALADGGVFHGQVVDRNNTATIGCEVVLLQDSQEVARTITDEAGRFSVNGLRGGVYEVTTSRGGGIYRLWAPRTAPPAAGPTALVVAGDVVRGQYGGGSLLNVISHPWAIAGMAAAGIGVALALDNGSSS
jgi:hypothetical protein